MVDRLWGLWSLVDFLQKPIPESLMSVAPTLSPAIMPSWCQHVGKCQSSGTFEWGFRQVTVWLNISARLTVISAIPRKNQFANVSWETLLINRTWLLKNRSGVGNKCHFRSTNHKQTQPHHPTSLWEGTTLPDVSQLHPPDRHTDPQLCHREQRDKTADVMPSFCFCVVSTRLIFTAPRSRRQTIRRVFLVH